jgi:hypothetical protein
MFQALLLLAGVASFVCGAYMIWRPLGFLIGGVLLFSIGLLMNKISEAQDMASRFSQTAADFL